jgi:hypothetical protein
VDSYGEHNVVVSSSGWFEMEQTIKRYEYRNSVMQFLNIDDPTRVKEFNDERCIVKISSDDSVDS